MGRCISQMTPPGSFTGSFPSSMAAPSVSIIIPARNERGNIEAVIRRIPDFPGGKEIIFVEGHSTDGTLEEIRRVSKMFPQMAISYRVQDGIGKANAVWRGFDLARNDILMILDADMTVPPEDLSEFYGAIAADRQVFVNGSRLAQDMESGAMHPINYVGNRIFPKIMSKLCRQRLSDTLCGTKVLWRHDYERLRDAGFIHRMHDPFGDFTLLLGASALGRNIVEVPIRYRRRTYDATKIRRFRDGWKLCKILFYAWKNAQWHPSAI